MIELKTRVEALVLSLVTKSILLDKEDIGRGNILDVDEAIKILKNAIKIELIKKKKEQSFGRYLNPNHKAFFLRRKPWKNLD